MLVPATVDVVNCKEFVVCFTTASTFSAIVGNYHLKIKLMLLPFSSAIFSPNFTEIASVLSFEIGLMLCYLFLLTVFIGHCSPNPTILSFRYEFCLFECKSHRVGHALGRGLKGVGSGNRVGGNIPA